MPKKNVDLRGYKSPWSRTYKPKIIGPEVKYKASERAETPMDQQLKAEVAEFLKKRSEGVINGTYGMHKAYA